MNMHKNARLMPQGRGLLVQRVLAMIQRNCGGRVPQPGPLTPADETLLEVAGSLLARLRVEFHAQAFHRALEGIWEAVGAANRYVDEQAPWALRKSDPKRMETVLHVLAETIRRIAILVQPVMPASAAKLLDQLGVPADARAFADLGPKGRLEPGTKLPPPQPVFPRYVEAEPPEPGATAV